MILTWSMHWIYLKGTVGSSVSKRLCEKVSEVTSLKKLLQFETILRTLNIELSSASQGCAPRPPLLGLPGTSKKNPPFQNPAHRPTIIQYKNVYDCSIREFWMNASMNPKHLYQRTCVSIQGSLKDSWILTQALNVGQVVAYVTNETHKCANFIHVAICDHYVTAVFLNKIHSCNEFNCPCRTANNALNVKVYNYSV